MSKAGLSPHPSSFPTDQRLFLCCSSLCIADFMWHLFCPYLFLISPSLGALEGLCFVIVVFPGYLHLYFWLKNKSFMLRYERKISVLGFFPIFIPRLCIFLQVLNEIQT